LATNINRGQGEGGERQGFKECERESGGKEKEYSLAVGMKARQEIEH